MQTNGVDDPAKQRNDPRIRLANNIRYFPSRISGLRGPGLNTLWDVSIVKQIHASERVRAQPHVEFLDAFNRVVYANPNTDPTAAEFGKVTSQNDHPFDLSGRVALVTGASRGIGAAMARALASCGADVILHASRSEPDDLAAAIARENGVKASCLVANLEQREEAYTLVPRALAAAGRLDILVNNAGIIRRADAVDYSDADWDAVLEVDLSSVFRLCRAAGRHMLAEGRGKIVNVSSLLAFQGGIRVPAYAAAKAGVAQLTKALANEWAGRGVNVNAIAPGYIRTDNTRALAEDPIRYKQILERIPAGRWGDPQDLAGAVVFLASPAADYVHGHVLVVDGGWMGR